MDIQLFIIKVGKIIAKIPYEIRIRQKLAYRYAKKDLQNFNLYNTQQQQKEIYYRVKKLVDYSYSNINFYRSYYDQMGFHPSQLNSFKDISLIPIISKSILLKTSISERSFIYKDSVKKNTGGSSGQTLDFYERLVASGNEWAHMHHIWKKLHYKTSQLLLKFGGRSDIKKGLDYNLTTHTLLISAYIDFEKIELQLLHTAKTHSICYLQGYPSSIYEFALFCESHAPELVKVLRLSLKGVLLGSEFPVPLYRDAIERVFLTETISWYGHTEGCILAWEKEQKFQYSVFQSYGYGEAIKLDEQDRYSLIGTNYFNFSSPLIRYDTEDIIDDIVEEDGILESFSIYEGRKGQFILDKNLKKISLTGLIFGRHHKLFDYCTHIQISQSIKGKATVLYVLRQQLVKIQINPDELFDNVNVNIEFKYKKLLQPIKTRSGKVNILVKYSE